MRLEGVRALLNFVGFALGGAHDEAMFVTRAHRFHPASRGFVRNTSVLNRVIVSLSVSSMKIERAAKGQTYLVAQSCRTAFGDLTTRICTVLGVPGRRPVGGATQYLKAVESDIVAELREFGISAGVADPLADPEEAKREYAARALPSFWDRP